MPQLSLHSPVGDLTITDEDDAIIALDWGWARDQGDTALLRRAKEQLDDYFDRQRRVFDLPLAPRGTDFQIRVYKAMCGIEFGATKTYGELCADAGGVARAIGTACGSNPIPIIIPCHRVLAANGLGGYSGQGGVDTKAALLRLEGVLL